MERATAYQLININRQFYQTFASEFSHTRQRIQPGIQRLLARLPKTGSILDLGCGNGQLRQALVKAGFSGCYTGLDSSPGLLDIARETILSTEANHTAPPRFIEADLTVPGWEKQLLNAIPDSTTISFDAILAFAVLHHLPGKDLRLDVLEKIRALLQPQGRFIHSEWQFLNSPRLVARIQPWSTVGLSHAEIDPGDYLLDWRSGGNGLRYAHHFSFQELEELAERSGFNILETFGADGKEGNLAIYQVWSRDR